jgi:hypothetical protein
MMSDAEVFVFGAAVPVPVPVYRNGDIHRTEVGGTHYLQCPIQPVQFIEANKLGFLEGCVVKRMARHDKSTGKGRQDIEKAIHELQLLLEHRYPEGS